MASRIQDGPNRAAYDVQGSQDVRSQFQQNPQQGLKAAAQQFETMFLQMVLKSMRDATPQDGLFNSEQSRFFTGLLDQQLAQDMSKAGSGLGFARLIEQQLGQQLPGASAVLPGGSQLAPAAGAYRNVAVASPLPTSAAYAQSGLPAAASDNAKAFVAQIWPHAVDASRSTGIAPQFLVAQAALESGWGKSEIRRADGRASYNLFGIKAGKGWTGDSVEVATTEYQDGQRQSRTERFRSYNSYGEAFQDYANLLRNNPRYSGVIGSQNGAEFGRQLQSAGYASDPAYAEKLSQIINGPTLRQALIG